MAAGAEDPAFGRSSAAPSLAAQCAGLTHIAQGTNVDIEGSGEILRITALPTPGAATVTWRQRLLVECRFPARTAAVHDHAHRIPATARRADLRRWPGCALDAEDSRHPEGRRRVPATFFIVGENAMTERGLLERMIREGHEIGSHTYTHPNLATAGRTRTLFELNATQRLFQAFTGRTLKLFRAPFFGDAEPTTADEMLPVLEAQNRGYVSVGPARRQRGLAAAGRPGDRQQCRCRGCERPAELQRSVRRAVQPQHRVAPQFRRRPQPDGRRTADHHRYSARTRISLRARVGTRWSDAAARRCRRCRRSDHLAARIDLGLFELLGFCIRALGFLFAAAITLGIARALVASGSRALVAAWQGAAQPASSDRRIRSSVSSFRRSTRSG